MFCQNCGKQVENDAKFCEFCGSTLKKEQASQNAEPKKKSSAPLIIGLVTTFLVIAIAAVVLIIVFVNKDDKKPDKDNKATEVMTEYTNNSETKEPNTENITTDKVTTEPITEDKISSDDNTTENNYSDDDVFFNIPNTWKKITDDDVTFYMPGEYKKNGDNDNVYTISDKQGYNNSFSYAVNDNTVSEEFMREEFKKAIESTYGTGYDLKTIVVNGRKWEIYEFLHDDYVENYCAITCLFVDEDKVVYMEELTRLDSNSYIKNIIKTVEIE